MKYLDAHESRTLTENLNGKVFDLLLKNDFEIILVALQQWDNSKNATWRRTTSRSRAF